MKHWMPSLHLLPPARLPFVLGAGLILSLPQGHPSFSADGRAVRGTAAGCEAAILCNQGGSPWPDLVRPSTSLARTLWLAQDVGARDEPGQGVFRTKTRSKPLGRTAFRFSPDTPAADGRTTDGDTT